MCEIELKPSEGKFFHVWKQKNFFSAEKLFFFFYEWKLIFHEQDQQNVCISTCETPNQKKTLF